MLQLLSLSARVFERRQQLQHQRAQRLRVVRQFRRLRQRQSIRAHTATILAPRSADARAACRSLWPAITGPTRDAGQLHSVEQHRQIGRRDRQACRVLVGASGRKAESPAFQSRVPQRIAVRVPIQDLHPVAAFRTKHEQMALRAGSVGARPAPVRPTCRSSYDYAELSISGIMPRSALCGVLRWSRGKTPCCCNYNSAYFRPRFNGEFEDNADSLSMLCRDSAFCCSHRHGPLRAQRAKLPFGIC